MFKRKKMTDKIKQQALKKFNDNLNKLSDFDKNLILWIKKAKPEIIIHSAGIANPDECEKDKERAYQINTQGTKCIVDACQRNRAGLVFISSSHVFSEGAPSEKDEPNPINYYGKTKVEAENYIRENLENHIILRPTKLYGFTEEGNDFTKDVVNKLKNNSHGFWSVKIIFHSF